MQKLNFSITINAPVQRVRHDMFDKEGYKIRTKPFNEAGSRYEGDRSEGSSIHFLGYDPNNPEKVGGMNSRIAENKQFQVMSIEHLGEIADGEVKPNADRAGAKEIYYFKELSDGNTELTIQVDMVDEYIEYMSDARPKALDVLKNISEKPLPLLTVKAIISASIGDVRQKFTTPADVMQRNHASDDRHCPHAENDLRVGGRFVYRMSAKDGSFSFDFMGTFSEVQPEKVLSYIMDDGRKATVSFATQGDQVEVTTSFEAESMNAIELQEQGWGAILENFKKYVENNT